MGETEDEKDAALADIEKECLSVYKRKVEEASRCKANLLKAIALGRAEIAAIGSSMGGQEIHESVFKIYVFITLVLVFLIYAK